MNLVFDVLKSNAAEAFKTELSSVLKASCLKGALSMSFNPVYFQNFDTSAVKSYFAWLR